jgi:hypothetical protein
MRRRPAQIVITVLALVVAFGAAGCGSSNSSTSTTTTTTTAAATTAAAPTTTAAAATTTSTAATSTSAAGTTTASAAGLGALGSAANCKQLASLGATFSKAFTGAAGDPAKIEALLQQFAAAAPPAVKADFQTIADAYSKIAAALGGAGLTPGKVPDAATLAKLAALSSQLDVKAITAASQHIAAWAAANCHP